MKNSKPKIIAAIISGIFGIMAVVSFLMMFMGQNEFASLKTYLILGFISFVSMIVASHLDDGEPIFQQRKFVVILLFVF